MGNISLVPEEDIVAYSGTPGTVGVDMDMDVGGEDSVDEEVVDNVDGVHELLRGLHVLLGLRELIELHELRELDELDEVGEVGEVDEAMPRQGQEQWLGLLCRSEP